MTGLSVCFLGYQLHPPWTEGTKVLTRDFMRALADSGAQVSGVSTIGPKDLRANDLDIRYVSRTGAAAVAERLGFSPTTTDLPKLGRLALVLRRQVDRNGADVVHAGFASHTIFSAICSIPPQVPFVAQTFGRVENQPWLRRLRTPRRVDAYVTCSYGDVNRLGELGVPNEHVHRVPPRVEVTEGSSATGRDLLELDPESFAVGYIGHVKSDRLPEAFLSHLDAFAADSDTDAVIVTKERAGRCLRSFVNVSVVERSLSSQEKADVYSAIDAWVFPYDFNDPSRPPVIDPPLTLLEAMGAGRPVVAASTLSIPEYVREGETGLLHPPGDHEQAIDHLEALRSGQIEATAIGKAARRQVARSFDSDTVAQALRDVYDSVR